jgi:hypothetical protein
MGSYALVPHQGISLPTEAPCNVTMAPDKDHEFFSIGSFWVELSSLGQICPFSPAHVPRLGSLAVIDY